MRIDTDFQTGNAYNGERVILHDSGQEKRKGIIGNLQTGLPDGFSSTHLSIPPPPR